MFKILKNKLIILILVAFIIPIVKVNAEYSDSNIIDFQKNGSLKVTLSKEDYLNEAQIGLYFIAEAKDNNHNLVFNYTNPYSQCPADLSNLNNNQLPGELIKCTKNKKADYLMTPNQEGLIEFSNLPLGLYLVKQENKLKGSSNFIPFLVSIPKVIDKKWTYDITSSPKLEIYKAIDIKVSKVWNKQNQLTKLPKQVTVELLKDSEVIDTVILNDSNNWTYTWSGLESSDEYSVKEIDIPYGYTATYHNDGFTYTITNTDKLPKTGQEFSSVIILSATGIFLILLGIYKMKNGSNEK